MERRLQLDKLLEKEISTAECRGGSCHGIVSSIEDVDYTSYLWSGVILGGRAIFVHTNFGGPMTDVERLEEASRKRLQAMLALWYGRRRAPTVTYPAPTKRRGTSRRRAERRE